MAWSERAGKWFCFLAVGVGIYVVIKYSFGIFLPFIIAWGLAMLTNPIAKKLSDRLHLSRKLCSGVLTLILLCILAGVVYLAVNRLVFETERLFVRISEDSERIGETIGAFFDRISSIGDKKSPILESLLKVEQFKEFWENIDGVITNVITSTVSTLTEWIPGFLLGFIKRLPGFMIFLLITVVSCFYFSSDIDNINRSVVSFFPRELGKRIPIIKKRVFEKLSGYVRAYLLLLVMTFGELLVGFWILGVPYPLLLALLISILDILPILGVGTALIPWALIEILFTKDLYTGIGLFIVYVIITVVRQITEPKIVAGSLGLPPLLTLIAMYVGLKLFGFWGIVLGPFSLLIIRSIGEFSPDEDALDTKRAL